MRLVPAVPGGPSLGCSKAVVPSSLLGRGGMRLMRKALSIILFKCRVRLQCQSSQNGSFLDI